MIRHIFFIIALAGSYNNVSARNIENVECIGTKKTINSTIPEKVELEENKKLEYSDSYTLHIDETHNIQIAIRNDLLFISCIELPSLSCASNSTVGAIADNKLLELTSIHYIDDERNFYEITCQFI